MRHCETTFRNLSKEVRIWDRLSVPITADVITAFPFHDAGGIFKHYRGCEIRTKVGQWYIRYPARDCEHELPGPFAAKAGLASALRSNPVLTMSAILRFSCWTKPAIRSGSSFHAPEATNLPNAPPRAKSEELCPHITVRNSWPTNATYPRRNWQHSTL